MKRWQDAEDVDFDVTTRVPAGMWLWLRCSICGEIDAATEPRDLGYLDVAAQRHYERKHGETGGALQVDQIPPL
jgi:hypothetical protein